MIKIKKPELIAPAGSLKKLKYVFAYGADAVYLGVPDFSMRARVNDFNLSRLKAGIKYAHDCGKKVFVTINIYAHNRHLKKLEDFIIKLNRQTGKQVNSLQPDALVVSDPGVLQIVKKNFPKIPIHLSTQANTTNWQAAKFWYDQGVSRIILARELTLKEIAVIHKKVPKLELEYFVHGAMCMAYSGRCILSKWMTGRSANLGDCAHSCRWKYRMSDDQEIPNVQFPMSNKIPNPNDQNLKSIFLEEAERPSEIIPVEEDEHGTYIFNSKDLCLIDHLPELRKAGVMHFKIEGRSKSIYYLAVVTKLYRQAIDKGRLSKGELEIINQELRKLTNRGYHTGFLFGKDKFEHLWDKQQIKPDYMLVGEVIKNENCKVQNAKLIGNYKALVLVHNMLNVGDRVQAIVPFGENVKFTVKGMVDVKIGEKIEEARGGRGQKVLIMTKHELPEFSVLRKKC